jgi:hypothetical protein
MLDECLLKLAETKIDYRSHNYTVQEFLEQQKNKKTEIDHWDIAQATFSLQNISSEHGERVHTLKGIHNLCKRLLIAEFDVGDEYQLPTFDPRRVDYIRRVVTKGVNEYHCLEDKSIGELVCQGFLMPMLFNYFEDPVLSQKKVNYEQSAAKWKQELEEAGFKKIAIYKIYDYWWAKAVLIDAQ